MMTSDLQARLDALEYPPTHCYRLADMTPHGVLARRAAVVESMIERCTNRRRALEIGFNKGYFLHLFSRHFETVDGCEPWAEYHELVSEVRECENWSNVRSLHSGGFDSMPWSEADGRYDFIFLGNCMHYLYRDAGNFSFVGELARRCNGWMLIEGFSSLAGNDAYMVGARKKWSRELQEGFDDVAFSRAVDPHFVLTDMKPSPTDRDRQFMLFRRTMVDEGMQ